MEASAFPSSSAGVSAGARPSRVSLLRLRSDEQLLAQFRLGSDEAFGVLFNRYQSRLLSYTRRMLAGSQQDAEDALQDVFLRAYGALRADERPVSVRAWLYRVAHNRCIDHIRRATPAPEDIYAVSRPTAVSDPETALERREDLRQVVRDLGALPETQRSALLLREMEGLSYVELAATLDLTMPAVKSVLVRARTSLAETSEARGTSCVEIRTEIDGAFDAGARPEPRSKRHMKECDGCRDYYAALRSTSSAQAQSGPIAFLAKLLGLGGVTGAGTGVAGGAAAGSTAIGTKLAALVCCGMVVAGAGAAVELPRQIEGGSGPVHAAPVAHGPSASSLARALHLGPALPAAAAGASQPSSSSHAAAPAAREPRVAPRSTRVEMTPVVPHTVSEPEPVAPTPVDDATAEPEVVAEPPIRRAPTAITPTPAPATPAPATGAPTTPAMPAPTAPTAPVEPPAAEAPAPAPTSPAPTSPAPAPAPTSPVDSAAATY